jgi:hypothetical protein
LLLDALAQRRQRDLSRKQKGSANRAKARVNVAMAAGLAVTACGAQVRPGLALAQRGEAGTHPKSHPEAA